MTPTINTQESMDTTNKDDRNRKTRNPYMAFTGNKLKEKELLQQALTHLLQVDKSTHLLPKLTPHLKRKFKLQLHRQLPWTSLTAIATQIIHTKLLKTQNGRTMYSKPFYQQYMDTHTPADATEDEDEYQTPPQESHIQSSNRKPPPVVPTVEPTTETPVEPTIGHESITTNNTPDGSGEPEAAEADAATTEEAKDEAEDDTSDISTSITQVERTSNTRLAEERQRFMDQANATETLAQWIEVTMETHLEKMYTTQTSIINLFSTEYRELTTKLNTMNTQVADLQMQHSKLMETNRQLQTQLDTAYEDQRNLHTQLQAQQQATQDALDQARPKEIERVTEMLRESLLQIASKFEADQQHNFRITQQGHLQTFQQDLHNALPKWRNKMESIGEELENNAQSLLDASAAILEQEVQDIIRSRLPELQQQTIDALDTPVNKQARETQFLQQVQHHMQQDLLNHRHSFQMDLNKIADNLLKDVTRNADTVAKDTTQMVDKIGTEGIKMVDMIAIEGDKYLEEIKLHGTEQQRLLERTAQAHHSATPKPKVRNPYLDRHTQTTEESPPQTPRQPHRDQHSSTPLNNTPSFSTDPPMRSNTNDQHVMANARAMVALQNLSQFRRDDFLLNLPNPPSEAHMKTAIL